ncbi:MAG: Glutamine transport ATP-binding protein GlnQ [Parcubacteria group bacterium ADurb.Bin316]|nr:MAG: Glutamine transport ATP-binding protein GlnQ [Parcubacteria group bacterium ADurb.Bin316]
MKILETKNLIKRFNGVNAVDRLSIKIEKGQITGIIGPNGSGKTTLINLLSGVLVLDDGEVILNKTKKLSRILPYQIFSYGITRTFQNVRLFEQMTVLDNILVVITERNAFSSLFEKHTEYHYKLAKEILQKVGLWEKKNQLAVNLSYGQRKLLEIARALAMKAEIYLFDEPFAGLFPEMRKIVSDIVQGLKRKNKTIILVEHDMGLIREICDYVIVMNEGKLLAEGKPADVLKKREVIEAYLGN